MGRGEAFQCAIEGRGWRGFIAWLEERVPALGGAVDGTMRFATFLGRNGRAFHSIVGECGAGLPVLGGVANGMVGFAVFWGVGFPVSWGDAGGMMLQAIVEIPATWGKRRKMSCWSEGNRPVGQLDHWFKRSDSSLITFQSNWVGSNRNPDRSTIEPVTPADLVQF